MPLGPQLFVSLADRPDAVRIGDAQAAVLNDWQVSVRRTHLIRRPLGERGGSPRRQQRVRARVSALDVAHAGGFPGPPLC